MQKRKKIIILSFLSALSIGGGILIGTNKELGLLKAIDSLKGTCTHSGKVNFYEPRLANANNIGKNQPYWICCGCSRCFLDEKCTKEIKGTDNWNGVDLAKAASENEVKDISGREGNILDFLNAKIDNVYTDGINGGTDYGRNNYEYVDIDEKFAFKFSVADKVYTTGNPWTEIRFTAENITSFSFNFKINEITADKIGSDGINNVHTLVQIKDSSYHALEMNLISNNEWNSITVTCPTEFSGTSEYINIKLCKFIGDIYISNLEYTVKECKHSYGEPVYTWNEDCTECTASKTCSECGDVQSESGSMSEVSSNGATPFVAGYTTYKATFDAFEETTKKVKTADKLTTFAVPGCALEGDRAETKVTGTDIPANAPEGFNNFFKVSGNGKVVSRFTNFDLSLVKEFSFAVYPLDSGWFEPKNADGTADVLFSWGSQSWCEYKLVDEGNGYFQTYKNGGWHNSKMPLNVNLQDYMAKLGSGKNFVISEIVAKTRAEDYVSNFKKILDAPMNTTGLTKTNVDSSLYIDGDVKSVSYTYKNSQQKTIALPTYSLERLNEVLFKVRGVGVPAYTKVTVAGTAIGEEQQISGDLWNTIRLLKNGETWTAYYGSGRVEGLTLDNTNQISLKYAADKDYAVSEVFAR